MDLGGISGKVTFPLIFLAFQFFIHIFAAWFSTLWPVAPSGLLFDDTI